MVATTSLAVVVASLMAAPVVVTAPEDPEPPPGRHRSLLLALSLPRVGLPGRAKAERYTPALRGSDLEIYANRAKDKSAVYHVIRGAHAALWACSDDLIPEPLLDEVNVVRQKNKIDPRTLRLRYAIPNPRAEDRLKNEAFQVAKDLSRLTACLEDTLEALAAAQEQAKKEGPRWEAHLTLLRLWVTLRLGVLEEYQGALGRMRKEVPEYDVHKHTALHLMPDAKVSDLVAKRYVERADLLQVTLLQRHKNSTWDRLGRKALESKFGVRWEAVE